MQKNQRPVPTRLSQWGSATEIIYSCPSCGCSLGFYGQDERFCHNCGTPISWNVLTNVNAYLKNKYHAADIPVQKAIMCICQSMNEGCNSGPSTLCEWDNKAITSFEKTLKKFL